MDTILVVDDDRGTLLLIEPILSHEPHRLLMAGDAAEARSILTAEAGRILAILLDWDLPDTSGIELLEEIKSQNALADTPVIMETAMDTAEQIRAGIDAGAWTAGSYSFRQNVYRNLPELK